MNELAPRSGATSIIAGLQPQRPMGLEAFEPRQLGLQPAELRIIHQIRGQNEVGRPGQLRIGNQVFDELEVVFLKAHPFRQLMEGEKEKAVPTCASLDCREPLSEIVAPKAQDCRECEYGQWDTNPSTGKRIPPLCAEGIAFLGVRKDQGEDKPFWFICKKSAQREARDFLGDVVHDPDVSALHQLRVKVTTKMRRENGVIWYVPVFTVLRPLMDVGGPYAEMMAAAADVFFTPRVQQNGAGAVETTSTPVPQAHEVEAVGWNTEV